jgi:haloacetate dehalogenase
MKTGEQREVQANQSSIFISKAGEGPPLLLLHGFPQTHLMWRHLVPLLADDFTVICADLPGYGRSGCPPSAQDHMPHSKRTMARELIYMMEQIGFQEFSVVGHDRGGRVAYRMALDHPQVIQSVSVLDILPTAEVWDRADKKFALDFWPWSLLAQAPPLPEMILEKCAKEVINSALDEWGTPPETFDARIREAYHESLRDPSHIHAICEEYRAAATVDHEHDLADLEKGKYIECPLLVLWSKYLDLTYGGSDHILSTWSRWARNVKGERIDGGHFFAEEKPMETARLLQDFQKGTKKGRK